jgi:glycosyltransferase involved in cell wall biosynthesis
MTSHGLGAVQPSALLYEPRVEGHHLVWLKFIVEDLLSGGYKLTLALDNRPESAERIRSRLGPLLEAVSLLPVWDEDGRRVGGGGVGGVAACFARAGTQRVFLNSFDEIASRVLRLAALGKLPPPALRGRMGGIYLRPRFLARRGLSPNEWSKALGFGRLMRGGWLTPMLFLDPWIQSNCHARYPQTPAAWLPDPCPDNFVTDAQAAREQFDLPAERKVFLFYGGAYRRKGLHLAVEALLGLPRQKPLYLLCAGQQDSDPRVQQGLKTLVSEGRAQVISRYIYEQEEQLLFAASDFVLLPYIKHFGNSAVLSRAAGAGKPVIASDEELVGRFVREQGLGLLFPSGNAPALAQAMLEMLAAPAQQMNGWKQALAAFAQHCSRAAFRQTLLAGFGAARPS